MAAGLQANQRLSDVEAERYVLSACLIWPEDHLGPSIAAIGELNPWTVGYHADIWGAMVKLAAAKAPIMPSEIVKFAPNPSDVGAYLDGLADIVHGEYCQHYVKAILNYERRRAVCEKAKRLMHAAAEGMVNGQLEELADACRKLDAGEDYKPPVDAMTGLDLITSPPIQIDWIIKPLFARGKLTQLQGEPKGGKSVFALYASMAAALGYWLAGQFQSCGKPLTVLFLSSEDASNILQQRLTAYFKGFGVGSPEDLIRLVTYPQEQCASLGIELDTEDGRRNMENLIRYVGADVVVLDSLSNFNNGDENAKKEMQPVMTRLRKIALGTRVALMYLHHTGKPQAGVQRTKVAKSRGSGAIAAAWDICIDWGDRGGTNITPVSIMSKLGEDGDYDIEYSPQDDGSVKWSVGDPLPKENSKAVMKKIMNAVRELFKTCPDGALAVDIAGAVGMSKEMVRQYLAIAEKEGQIKIEKGARNASLYVPI